MDPCECTRTHAHTHTRAVWACSVTHCLRRAGANGVSQTLTEVTGGTSRHVYGSKKLTVPRKNRRAVDSVTTARSLRSPDPCPPRNHPHVSGGCVPLWEACPWESYPRSQSRTSLPALHSHANTSHVWRLSLAVTLRPPRRSVCPVTPSPAETNSVT